MPLWTKVLLTIPKNLVYVFFLIIVFAFCAMLFITSTGYELSEFTKYNQSVQRVAVSPVLQ